MCLPAIPIRYTTPILLLTLDLFRSKHPTSSGNPLNYYTFGIGSLNQEGVKGMAHTAKDKGRLLNRVRRIKGQITAIERALDGDQECSKEPQTIAACRGAINGLMAEVLEGHVR